MLIKKNCIISLFFLLPSIIVFSQSIPQDSLYLGQQVPGNIPKIFNLPITPGLRPVERPAISSDYKEIYYSELDTYEPNIEKTSYFIYKENRWQGPFLLFNGFMAPRLTANDSTMYLQKNVNNIATAFVSKRTAGGWSEPQRIFSANKQNHYFQTTGLNNSFVSTNLSGGTTNRDICKVIVSNNDTTFQSLGLPINTSNYDENDFFVAYDESYMLLSRSNTSSPGDIYISYKKNDGRWTNPKNLGPDINLESPNWEYGHFVPNNNKYMFFTRGSSPMSTYSIYWVKFDTLLDSLKHTNFTPYLLNNISGKTIIAGQQFSFVIPDSVFIDDDGNNTLTYTATLSNGMALPSWLSFNAATRTLSGTPLTALSTNIKITVKDNASAQASVIFPLTVTSGIEEGKSLLPEKVSLEQNYPNPFNPETSIKFSIINSGKYNLKVYDSIGKLVRVVADREYAAGQYIERFNAGELPSGMYFYQLTGETVSLSGKMVLLK